MLSSPATYAILALSRETLKNNADLRVLQVSREYPRVWGSGWGWVSGKGDYITIKHTFGSSVAELYGWRHDIRL